MSSFIGEALRRQTDERFCAQILCTILSVIITTTSLIVGIVVLIESEQRHEKVMAALNATIAACS